MLTFSYWTGLDSAMRAHLSRYPSNPTHDSDRYVLLGGLPTYLEAFYGDDLWGYHKHGLEEEPYHDDRAVYTAVDPGSWQPMLEVEYAGFRESFNGWWADFL